MQCTAAFVYYLGPNLAVIILGAYIAHPGPQAAKHAPSVAAVVADHQGSATHYPDSMLLQSTIKKGGVLQSLIVEIQAMIEEHLKAWKAKHTPTTGSQEGKPNRVIFS